MSTTENLPNEEYFKALIFQSEATSVEELAAALAAFAMTTKEPGEAAAGFLNQTIARLGEKMSIEIAEKFIKQREGKLACIAMMSAAHARIIWKQVHPEGFAA